jgi:site-specific DNA-adenine methylase
MLKTLLKCPDKFVSGQYLLSKIQTDDKIRGFGLRSGYIEFGFHENEYNITVGTNRYFVWEFWKCLTNCSASLLRNIKFFHKNLTTQEVAFYQDNWFMSFDDPYERAAFYYLLNRYSSNGTLSEPYIDKNNLSILNLSFFEDHASNAKNIKLRYDRVEDLTECFSLSEPDEIVLVPVGKFKKSLFLENRAKLVDTPTFPHEAMRDFLQSQVRRSIFVYKYDPRLEKLYDNKTYINKFGKVTENPEMAEDLIVSNF